MLELKYNKIETIENISHLTKLERLYLSQNIISQISGLEGLTSLKLLLLTDNKLKEIDGGLESQKNSITGLYIDGNQISDWPSIKYLGKTLNACLNLSLFGNPIHDEADFKNKAKDEFEKLEELI